VPRDEPPSWASGGKVVKVDRVEWLYMPEYSTAAAALGDAELDWWEAPPLGLVPLLAANPDVTVEKTDPLGSTPMLRFNHLHPPFNNVKMRQAILAVTDQADFMNALAGDPKNWTLCPSFFTCGTPMANNAGSEALTGKRDFAKAKKLIAEAGYKGEKIVVLEAVDTPTAHAHGLVVFELLKKLGLNAQLDSSDWGTLVIRRASKNRSRRAVGASLAPVGPASRRSTRRLTCRWRRMAAPPGSAGRATRNSRPYGRNG
jgi:peptide/nickel transport system substrate-binding protein